MSEFTVRPLGSDRIREAYPLVRSTTRVTQERWETFARDLCEQGPGLLAVFAEDGNVHGLAAYRQLGTLRHEKGLFIEVIVTFELTRAAPVRKALRAALEEVARNLGCPSLIFTVTAADHGDARHRMSWEDLGLEMETVSFVQHIAQPPRAIRS